MTSEKARTRKRYGVAMKAQILTECGLPGASVAKVALAHGINANVVHRWRQFARAGSIGTPAKTGEFISLPLTLPPTPSATPADVRVEMRRGAVSISITWPLSAAAEFAAWMRELLR